MNWTGDVPFTMILHYFKRSDQGWESLSHPSDVWYEERIDFGPKALGAARISHKYRFDLLQVPSLREKILGNL